MKTKQKFNFRFEWIDTMKYLDSEDFIPFFKAIEDYMNDKEPELPTSALKLMFSIALPSIKDEKQKYDKRVQLNRKYAHLGGIAVAKNKDSVNPVNNEN